MSSDGRPRKDLESPEYRKARVGFLELNETCHWCKRAKATTIDHVIEVDRGIDPMDQGNWVGACHKCNSRRGAEHLARKRNQTMQNRKKIQNSNNFFDFEKNVTDRKSVV